jgi:spore maturation protein CgeB
MNQSPTRLGWTSPNRWSLTVRTPAPKILVVKNGTELIETLRSLALEKAKRIGQAAWKRALGEHTYESRARQLEKILANQAVS